MKKKKKVAKRKPAKKKKVVKKKKVAKRKPAKKKKVAKKKKKVVKKKKVAKRKPAKKKKVVKKKKKPAKKKKVAKKKVVKKKKVAKKKKKRKVNPAFLRPLKASKALAEIVGQSSITRQEVTKRIWNHIKKNGLQDSKNRRNINIDAKLAPLFGSKKQVSMFELPKAVNKHLS